MLSSIHPLGERTRHNRWIITVSAFALGAVGTATLIGGMLGWAGSVLPEMSTGLTLATMGAIVLAAGLFDSLGLAVPGPRRQVNEHWIGTYRGWVYGGAFGVQLGAGLVTYVVTWGVYATFALQLVSGSALFGALIGAAFGLGRSITVVLAGRIDRASRLSSFHRTMSVLGPKVSIVSGYGALILGTVTILAVML